MGSEGGEWSVQWVWVCLVEDEARERDVVTSSRSRILRGRVVGWCEGHDGSMESLWDGGFKVDSVLKEELAWKTFNSRLRTSTGTCVPCTCTYDKVIGRNSEEVCTVLKTGIYCAVLYQSKRGQSQVGVAGRGCAKLLPCTVRANYKYVLHTLA